ncbi:MAG: glycosyltransferase family 2 protein [Alphaproteobacteria bacterium]
MSAPRLSALVVARNEEAQLADCLATLRFADEIVVVLDRSTDRSREIAEGAGARIVEGAWPIEGERRQAGVDACGGDWIVEVDADERVPEALAREIRQAIETAAPGHFLIPFDNYVGDRLVRHGWGASFGVLAAARLYTKGAKRWGRERVHPAVTLDGPRRRLETPMVHYVDRDVGDMIDRLRRYSLARAADLNASGEPLPSLTSTLRRSVSRFLKCYVSRKGFREGSMGFMLALMAALFPLLSHLIARIEREKPRRQPGAP